MTGSLAATFLHHFNMLWIRYARASTSTSASRRSFNLSRRENRLPPPDLTTAPRSPRKTRTTRKFRRPLRRARDSSMRKAWQAGKRVTLYWISWYQLSYVSIIWPWGEKSLALNWKLKIATYRLRRAVLPRHAGDQKAELREECSQLPCKEVTWLYWSWWDCIVQEWTQPNL